MANPICISPLKFYDDYKKQSRYKSYAYGHDAALITPLRHIPTFQFVVDTFVGTYTLAAAYICNMNNERISGDIKNELLETGFSFVKDENYYVAIYSDLMPISFITYEGKYYLELYISNQQGQKHYFSEVFCATSSLSDCLRIEYWNSGNRSFYLKNGVIAFPDNFRFKLYLKSELGKPEYEFEEEATKRLGYIFIESQVSKKVYRFNTIVPEFICDAMRIIRLCSDKTVHSQNEEYEAITFEIETEWQTQGDLASITCTFETDNIITNLGGFVPVLRGGDYNNDYNNDFNT